MTKLGTTDLDVSRLNLGGNVFGWSADEAASHAVLDAFTEAGGNFVDTADVYSSWAPGHSGGESETVLGSWLAKRGRRDDVVIATKVGMLEGLDNQRADTVEKAVEGSLRRLGVDRIDLYYAHRDDPETPLVETLAAYDRLVKAGKIRHAAASNFSGDRLREAAAIAEREGFAGFVALQPKYNLVERGEYERDLAPALTELGLPSLPYSSLASGFLSGKYRPGVEVESVRAAGASRYLDERGLAVLAALDEVAGARGVSQSAVALAWLAAQPTVAAPIASARTVEQLEQLLPALTLDLTAEEVARLSAASDVV
ncbi:aldo/keto reductase [Actinosynnema pretiosum subsp. pretiosum]|uniref:Aldo/keto reductase n=2 Tax=Actinosynnema TaxID=40566 RepID=C6WR21_ACTMD|nr:aldo/keto reductase [Actinosynnema mirum]ACU40714.1 aldo/keto reductase [Actinosynnema mirum DSM 43827]AXX34219.1 Oxidoreductase [Actinosynnema pretiosum subsp. pretiosum]QUF02061.1 aldo/keto reductase [Actinosynnema pretiosum subsp. pretiosum]